jgi:hypothetical protein
VQRFNQSKQTGAYMNRDFDVEMRYFMGKKGFKNLEKLRRKTDIGSNTTFIQRWKYPETFTAEQLDDMFDYLDVPYEKRIEIMGAIWGITLKT